MRHTAVTCVMEPSRASMVNTMWTYFSAEGVTNTLLWSCRRRSTLTNIAMTQAVTWDSRGTVFGQPLKLECDAMEDLMMPGCVSIANCHEHTAGDVPHCMMQTGCRMICRRSVQTIPSVQTQGARVSLNNESCQEFQGIHETRTVDALK